MIDLSIHNFRGLSRIRLVDDRPLSVIVGPNQSGKSSLAQAVDFAFCGMVNGISDSSLLVRRGHPYLRVV
jgi:AAA15 family ATPase/GTPase